MNKKRGRNILFLILGLFLIMISPLASAVVKDVFAGPSGQEIWNKVKYIFALQWIKGVTDLLAIMRILFFFFVFAVTFAVLNWLGGRLPWLSGRIPLVLALIIAAIGTIFTPYTLLVSMSSDYAFLASIIFLAPFMGLIGYGIFYFWNTNRWVAAILILLLIFLLRGLAITALEIERVVGAGNVGALKGLPRSGGRYAAMIPFIFPVSINFIKSKLGGKKPQEKKWL